MKKEEFTKNFKYTLRAKNGRIMAQSIIEFGSEEKPFPKDWKENAMVQSSLFDFKEEFLKSLFDVEIEEGDKLDNFTIPEGTFGKDWEKELMKFNKKQLIDFLRNSLIKMKEMESNLDYSKSLNSCDK